MHILFPCVWIIHWRNWQSYMLQKLSDYTGCRCRLFLIKIHDLVLDSGVNNRKLWAPNYILVFRENFFCWLTLCIITITDQVLKCPRTKLCIVKSTELSEKKLFETNLIRAIEEKFRKSYTDLKRKDIEFQVSDIKKVLLFGQKEKLSPRFIRPYEIIERIGLVAYHLALPSELQKIHNVFHVSMLRRYRSDPSHMISLADVKIQPDMLYSEETVKTLAKEVKEL
ncbi:DNA/RNA polymerases superfamily protein [Gossypium australe]|uniref:DNA/RNA polymerases superfamily protein n=1 Tax=Gossypium australe TaxID=47621 RepID=A0A5B6W6X6_9ROSI|nr:DNA/RNA polymerases superfamily protein [Gossypium australe]